MSTRGSLHVQVSVPSYFLCPISLELMQDPVILSSGQTFDRSSIQTWLDAGHCSCPVTRQPIDPDLEDPIPNHALRRMIQSWCVQNKSLGIERVLTPRALPSLADIPRLVDQIALPQQQPRRHPVECLDALRTLTRLALDRPRSRKSMLQAGALRQLGKLLSRVYTGLAPAFSTSAISAPVHTPRTSSVADEALKLLDLLVQAERKGVGEQPTEELVLSLANTLIKAPQVDLKEKAASVLIRLGCSDSLKRIMGGMQGFMSALTGLIREEKPSCMAPASAAEMTGLRLLAEVCEASKQNRVAAMEAGAIEVVTGLLASMGTSDKGVIELGLKAVDIMCQCAEARAAMVEVRFLRPVLKLMNSISERAAHHAVHILWLVLKWAPDKSKVMRLLPQEEALVKAMAVAQSATSSDTRLAARKLATVLCEGLPPSHLAQSMNLG